MKKFILPLLGALTACTVCLSAFSACYFGETYGGDPITDADFLTVSGQNIVNAEGKTVLLQGTNLGGWLHMEGWMDGGGFLPEKKVWANHYEVLQALSARFSEEQTQSLLATYQNAYLQKSDLEYIRSLGLNLVRIPFFWTEILDFDGNVRSCAFDQLDFAVQTCKRLGMYVVLDLHCAVGGHTGGWTTGGIYDSNKLWYDEECQAWTVKLWQTVASHYQNEPAVAGYDLLNEPVVPEESELDEDIPQGATVLTKVQMYDKLYRAVREIDQRHVCIMGAFFNFDSALCDPKEAGWENVMYQTHHYDDADKSEENQLNFALWQANYIRETKEKWNVPVLAGEFSFWSADKAWRCWFSTLNRLGVSWCNWTYKNTAQDQSLNWGLYHQPNVESVDYKNDSFYTIEKKWKSYATKNYTKNDFLAPLFTEATQRRTAIGTTDLRLTASSGEMVWKVFDGNLYGDDARWTSGNMMVGGEWLALESTAFLTVSRVELFTAGWDYSTDFTLSAYVDGEWKTLYRGAGHTGNQIITFPAVRTKQLKLTQNAAKNAWWSIYEIALYE